MGADGGRGGGGIERRALSKLQVSLAGKRIDDQATNYPSYDCLEGSQTK